MAGWDKLVGGAASAYVRTVRGLTPVGRRLGLLGWLEAGPRHGARAWLRSLFAVSDLDQMIALDVPWWTVDATRLAEDFLRRRPGAAVFEFGSGASTVWLARRAGRVLSVEHDPAWYEALRDRVRGHPNIALRLAPARPAVGVPRVGSAMAGWRSLDFAAYVETVATTGEAFDLIVIDGRCRAACLAAALPRLKPDGLIVFDNSARRRYRPAIEASGLVRRETRGRTYCLPYSEATCLLSRRADLLHALS
jgi:hypothetical protein